MFFVNVIIIPRFGYRSYFLGMLDPQCHGTEWSRKNNLTFSGIARWGQDD